LNSPDVAAAAPGDDSGDTGRSASETERFSRPVIVVVVAIILVLLSE